jgi:hypothetical protein
MRVAGCGLKTALQPTIRNPQPTIRNPQSGVQSFKTAALLVIASISP